MENIDNLSPLPATEPTCPTCGQPIHGSTRVATPMVFDDVKPRPMQGNLLETLANITSHDFFATHSAEQANETVLKLQEWVAGPTFSQDCWFSGVTETYARDIVTDIVARAHAGNSFLID